MGNKKAIPMAIGIIALAVLTLVMFTQCPEWNGNFWITYGFSVIGILGVLGNCVFMSSDSKSFAANLTLVTISVIYLLVDIGCSLLLSSFTRVVTYLVIHGVLLSIFVIAWLLGYSAVRHINSQDR